MEKCGLRLAHGDDHISVQGTFFAVDRRVAQLRLQRFRQTAERNRILAAFSSATRSLGEDMDRRLVYGSMRSTERSAAWRNSRQRVGRYWRTCDSSLRQSRRCIVSSIQSSSGTLRSSMGKRPPGRSIRAILGTKR